MAVHIRLRRMGKKKQPFYRIVAADHRRARDGRFLEILGTYNPIPNPAQVNLSEDKITKWLNEGAEPSKTVSTLFTQVGFTEKYLKLKKGEDVSSVEIKTEITERRKKTKKMKKAVAAAEEAKVTEAAEKTKAKEKSEAAEVAETKADDAKVEETPAVDSVKEAAPAEETATADEAAPADDAEDKKE